MRENISNNMKNFLNQLILK